MNKRYHMTWSSLWLSLAAIAGMAPAPDALAVTSKASVSGISTPAKAAFDKTLADAELLIKGGDAETAYALLAPLEFDHAGEERFDYLLGMAALDSGQPDKATFALERALQVNPNFTAARLEMARAYFKLGDMPRAKYEFQLVLKQNPTDTARTNIENYLNEISIREGEKRFSLNAYLEGGAGRDTNVNNSTSQSKIYVDTLATTATLDPVNIQTADNYSSIAIGGELNYHASGLWGIYAAADIKRRSYAMQTGLDALNLDARAGVAYKSDSNHLQLGANSGQFSLNNTVNHKSSGVHADWMHTINPGNQIRLSGQLMQYRFADAAMQSNDYDLQVLGLGWQHYMNEGNTATSISLYNGNEKDVSTILNPPATPNGGRTDGAKKLQGMRIGLQTRAGSSTLLYSQIGTQLGQYDRQNYWFQRTRADRFSDLTLGAAYQWDKLWSMRMQASYAVNESNIEIYAFNRTDISLSLRRDFR